MQDVSVIEVKVQRAQRCRIQMPFGFPHHLKSFHFRNDPVQGRAESLLTALHAHVYSNLTFFIVCKTGIDRP